jgi:hypothetical protein
MTGEYFKCLKPDCRRKVKPGVAYCCEPCQIAAEDRAPWELGPHDPAANWVLVHSEFCEQRKAERGECDDIEATMLAQVGPFR